MIYFCADDYGLIPSASARIRECVEFGCLNKISVLPNFEAFSIDELDKFDDLSLSLHLNLVEGKGMADKEKIKLLLRENGTFRFSFCGLLMSWFFNRKVFEEQVYEEIKAQVEFWVNNTEGELLIDSHQHTHMIPGVFKALVRVIKEKNLKVRYLRIPAEPVLPYLCTPSLYLTYNPVNIVKQWLLKALWLLDKKYYSKSEMPSALFCGILFSGKMDKKRVEKVLGKYLKIAKGKNIEVLFHPGYTERGEEISGCNESFKKFYYSNGRKVEYDSTFNIIKFTERSV